MTPWDELLLRLEVERYGPIARGRGQIAGAPLHPDRINTKLGPTAAMAAVQRRRAELEAELGEVNLGPDLALVPDSEEVPAKRRRVAAA